MKFASPPPRRHQAASAALKSSGQVDQRRRLREEFRVGAYRMTGGRMVEVLIGLRARNGLRYVGSARPAASSLARQLYQALRMLHVHTFCPFAGAAASTGDARWSECQCVEANVTVWVEHEGWDAAGVLVNPRIVAIN